MLGDGDANVGRANVKILVSDIMREALMIVPNRSKPQNTSIDHSVLARTSYGSDLKTK